MGKIKANVYRFMKVTVLGFSIGLMTVSEALAIYYFNLTNPYLRAGLAGFFVLATVAVFFFGGNRRRVWLGFVLVFAAVVVWWLKIPASNDRAWQPEVAVLQYASIQGDRVMIRRIRNLHYRTETDFDLRYEDRSFDLKQLGEVDLIAVYWMGEAIAHIMVSFGFGGKDYIAFSIETRAEKGGRLLYPQGIFQTV